MWMGRVRNFQKSRLSDDYIVRAKSTAFKNERQRRAEDRRNPVPTIDLIVRKRDQILLEQRAKPPFKGWYCFPGGHVEYGETVEAAAVRELEEETSIHAELKSILGVYSDPKRDPRGQRITTVFVANWLQGEPKGADDAKTAKWFRRKEIFELKLPLAFDHSLILQDYLAWATKNNGNKMPETFWSTKKR